MHGYLYDGWREDGLFHDTGEGQRGDQQMAQGNRAIRDHALEARELHVFEVANANATYLDEFDYVDHYLADRPRLAVARSAASSSFAFAPGRSLLG